MDDKTKTALGFARDTINQFITLASGIVALTVTFSKNFIAPQGSMIKVMAVVSWCCYLASILFGLLALMTITGTIARSNEQRPVSIYDNHIARLSQVQIIVFAVATVVTVVLGAAVLAS